MKKILSIVLVLVMTSTIMVGCGGKGSGTTDESNNLKVGVVLIGDKNDTYTKAHLDGIKSAAKEVGINPKNILVRDNIKENTCAKISGATIAVIKFKPTRRKNRMSGLQPKSSMMPTITIVMWPLSFLRIAI